MAGPRDERAAGTLGRSHLRAARADRERVIGLLVLVFYLMGAFIAVAEILSA